MSLRQERRAALRAKVVHKPTMETYSIPSPDGVTIYMNIFVYKEEEGCHVCGRQLHVHPHYKGLESAPFTVYRLCDSLAGRIEG